MDPAVCQTLLQVPPPGSGCGNDDFGEVQQQAALALPIFLGPPGSPLRRSQSAAVPACPEQSATFDSLAQPSLSEARLRSFVLQSSRGGHERSSRAGRAPAAGSGRTGIASSGTFRRLETLRERSAAPGADVPGGGSDGRMSAAVDT